MTERAYRRRRLVALAAAVAVLAALAAALALALGGGSHRPGRSARSSPLAARAKAKSRVRAAAAPPRTPPDRLAGLVQEASLPQTRVLPAASGQRFAALMDALWQGIVRDSTQAALPAFFPRAAYVQLKAISAAGADYDERLMGELRLDLGAAHELLGAGAPRARLREVLVPTQYAHWVQPGSCYNGIGYYEVPNARMVYELDGQLRSFGIASLISWRGVWYVVHLGAVLRSGPGGAVDEPAPGAGSSAYSSTC